MNQTQKAVYKTNADKIAREYGNAIEMCKAIGIPYGTYNSLIRSKRKKRIFQKQEVKNAFYKLIDDGYIEYIGESK
ncbi:hypothetical protein [Helicobacter cappadocius]|uniref:Uncharacterized protein n=1 Tax=Helicobacter cappadocius TaxID=3063998 RepID=A0AA90PKH5_9HELI|nr:MULTISPECIES: hypothetical protein [unclassified Helicobacter]MDO7252781.1 hypothetical protein [Helicobacter sp. faydin-H75]MDP2538824.1 hypothetical protein [Helicobacter sp. faydin-H76]